MKTTYEVPYLGHSVKLNSAEQILTVSVPGSKSITNRVLLLAAMARGSSTLRNVLFSDDSRALMECLNSLGFQMEIHQDSDIVIIHGHNGKVPCSGASVNVGSAGTAARFITALLTTQEGVYRMYASPQMQKRPMGPLLNSLKQLGADIQYDNPANAEHFPFTLSCKGWTKNSVTVNVDNSSQYLSALLIASCLSPSDFTIKTHGTHGMAYIQMTREIMAQFGVQTKPKNKSTYLIPAGQHYIGRDYTIEPDVSSACYFYAMSPLLNIPVMVKNIHENSIQGDIAFLSILGKMGCRYEDTERGIVLYPPKDGILNAVDVDMSSCSDQAITLAALAPFTNGVTTIRNIGHIRHQESDRLHGIATELLKMGIPCEEHADGLSIHPGSPTPTLVNTYEDHRMAMGFSLIGLRAPGIVIDNPACCSKTFEGFFDQLDELVERIKIDENTPE